MISSLDDLTPPVKPLKSLSSQCKFFQKKTLLMDSAIRAKVTLLLLYVHSLTYLPTYDGLGRNLPNAISELVCMHDLA